MPGHKLPPLNALRAFEAAARHLSMKDAGAELHVTPGAVSQMVRVLEQSLGVRLFRRLNRALRLTEAGQAYLGPVRSAFRQIAEATREASASAISRPLTISVSPAFAASWLVPRVGGFRARHPEIDLRIISSKELANFDDDGVDLAIRHGLGRYPGLHSDRLVAVALIPVCAPSVLRGGQPRGPADLLALPLLHDHERRDWALWFEAESVKREGALRGASFDDLVLLIGAAKAGQGVALVPEVAVGRELRARRLVRALDTAWPRDFAYWVVCPPEALGREKVAAFRDWLLEEASARRRECIRRPDRGVTQARCGTAR